MHNKRKAESAKNTKRDEILKSLKTLYEKTHFEIQEIQKKLLDLKKYHNNNKEQKEIVKEAINFIANDMKSFLGDMQKQIKKIKKVGILNKETITAIIEGPIVSDIRNIEGGMNICLETIESLQQMKNDKGS